MAEPPFPLPWTVKDNGSAFYIEDAAGHTFGFCYYREHATIGTGPWHLTRDQARRLAVNFAKLPAQLGARGAGPETQKARPPREG